MTTIVVLLVFMYVTVFQSVWHNPLMSNTTGKHQACKQASMQTRPAHSLADSFHNEEVFVAVFVDKPLGMFSESAIEMYW